MGLQTSYEYLLSETDKMDTTDEYDPEIEKQRSPHEPKHHWELKRKFMMAHRDKFPMKELAGLAQTLGNIEFTGCTYPQDTMRQVWVFRYCIMRA